jgi:hypothetical protein
MGSTGLTLVTCLEQGRGPSRAPLRSPYRPLFDVRETKRVLVNACPR